MLLNYSKFHLEKNKNKNNYFIKDCIHNEINFDSQETWLYELINTPEFQRLQEIKQLGFTHHNFPTCTHTRYTHSLGVYALMNKFIKNFIKNNQLSKEKDMVEINLALACALLHDIGHGPYSHFFEKVFNFSHEKMSMKIISSSKTKINFLLQKKSLEDGLNKNFYINEIQKIFNKKSNYPWIEKLISSKIDVDRLDYIARDKYFSGFAYGNLNYDLLIKWSTLIIKNKKREFFFTCKSKYLLFNFLVSRKLMYIELYNNTPTMCYEKIIIFLFNALKKNFKFLSEKEMEKMKNYLFLFKKQEEWKEKEFLALSDYKFDFWLEILKESKVFLIHSISNLFLGNEDLTSHKFIKINESDESLYVQFNQKYKEKDLLNEQIYNKNQNINETIIIYNEEDKKEEKISINLEENSKEIKYIKIISKNKYLDWIKYKNNNK